MCVLGTDDLLSIQFLRIAALPSGGVSAGKHWSKQRRLHCGASAKSNKFATSTVIRLLAFICLTLLNYVSYLLHVSERASMKFVARRSGCKAEANWVRIPASRQQHDCRALIGAQEVVLGFD
jgi:hypothetical protein